MNARALPTLTAPRCRDVPAPNGCGSRASTGWERRSRRALMVGNARREYLMGEQLISRRGRSETRILTRLEELAGGAQVIVLSNREPVTHERTNSGRPAAIHSSSGVVNAVEPLVAACGGVWVAHGAGSADRETASDRDGLRVPPGNPRYRLRRVWLSDEELDGYYRGFANEALWPLCHRAHVRPIFRTADLEAYWAVNGRFADAVCDEATTESPVVLV